MGDYRSFRERARELVPVSVDGRVPPNDLDAEAAVLSAIMTNLDERGLALDRVLEFLKPEHFYSEAHRRIYEACIELHAEGQPVDIVQVGTRLKKHERIAQVGGMGYLTEVLNAAPTVQNVVAYGKTIHEKWRVRQVIATCQRTAAEGYVDYGDPAKYIETHAAAVQALQFDGVKNAMQHVKHGIAEGFTELNDAVARGGRITGMATGYDRYDRMTAGLHEGDLNIFAARPGMGKTSLVCNVAVNVASPKRFEQSRGDVREEPGNGVIIFSLEMPRKQIATRMCCCEGRVDVAKVRNALLSPLDWNKLTQAASFLGGLPIWIDDTSGISLLELRAKVRRKQAEHDKYDESGKPIRKIGVVIVDYLQLMTGREGAHSREQEISEISRGLKGMAKELKLSVIALSQLNRAVETRSEKSKRPQLSDLRESGALEQDADNICFIYRDEYYHPDTAERGIAELIIGKQRSGPTGTAKVRFDKEYTRFDNLAEGQYEDDAA